MSTAHDNARGGGGGREPPDAGELMRMLLRFLPAKAEQMDNDRLVRWLRSAEVNLRMAYDVNGKIKIEAEAENKPGHNANSPTRGL